MAKLQEPPSPVRRAPDVSDPKVFAELVARAMGEAVDDAIADHHRAGNPVAIWHEGKVVLWYPDGTYRPVDESPEEPTAVTEPDSPA
jgi:hypothetical protein